MSVKPARSERLVLKRNSEIIAASAAARYSLGPEHPIAERLLGIVYELDENTPTVPAFWGEERDVMMGALQDYIDASRIKPDGQVPNQGTKAECAHILGFDLQSLGFATVSQEMVFVNPSDVA